MKSSLVFKNINLISPCMFNDGLMGLSFFDNDGDQVRVDLLPDQIDLLIERIAKARNMAKPNWNQTPAEVRTDKDRDRCQDMPDRDYGEREDNECDS